MPYLVEDIRSIVVGNAWHGPSWGEVTQGLTVDQSTRRILPGTHTIYELVHHTAAWAAEVARRLGGAQPAMPLEGDFPPSGLAVDDAAWQAAVTKLLAAHEDLLSAIERFDSARLDQHVGAERDAPLGSGVTYRAMIAGLLAHTAYHAGQAMLLRRAMER